MKKAKEATEILNLQEKRKKRFRGWTGTSGRRRFGRAIHELRKR